MTVASRGRADDGRIMLLVVGAALVLALLVAVVVDSARLYLARRSLDATADAVALAGAQAVDLAQVYRDGVDRDVPLDPRRVEVAARQHLDLLTADLPAASRPRLTAVRVDSDEVTVTTVTIVRLPFVGPVTRGRAAVPIESTATARNRLVPP